MAIFFQQKDDIGGILLSIYTRKLVGRPLFLSLLHATESRDQRCRCCSKKVVGSLSKHIINQVVDKVVH